MLLFAHDREREVREHAANMQLDRDNPSQRQFRTDTVMSLCARVNEKHRVRGLAARSSQRAETKDHSRTLWRALGNLARQAQPLQHAALCSLMRFSAILRSLRILLLISLNSTCTQ